METGKHGDALLKGGAIVDGKGGAPYRADVRVKRGRIAEIGPDLQSDGETLYDAAGCYVTPGFIDSHTHYDASLFWDPACDPILTHGYTTVLIGNCGLGLAPVKQQDVDGLSTLFSYIEDLPREVFATEIPWTWESYAEYAEHMRTRSYGVNVASLVSHSLLRQFVVGQEAWSRPSTPQEREQIGVLLADALEAGAFGVSTSRMDRNPAGDLVPSYHADLAEMETVFATTEAAKGVVQMIPNMVDVDVQISDITEMGGLSQRHGGVPVIANQIYMRPDDPAYADRLMAAAREIRAKGGAFYWLASPRSIDLLLNFHQSMNFMNVQSWNDLCQLTVPKEEKLRRLKDPEWRAQARAEWDGVSGGFPSGGMERLFRVVKVNRPDYERYVARTFDLILDERGGHPSDVLADWVFENDLEAEFVYPFSNTDMDQVGRLLKADESLISASDAGAHIAMFDGAGDATLILTRHVRDRADFPLEYAVKRMTSDQAKVLGLADRGTIEVGAIADLAVFDLEKLAWSAETKVADIPGGKVRFRRPPGGFRYTFVNGVLAQRDGTPTGALAAKFLGAQDKVAA